MQRKKRQLICTIVFTYAKSWFSHDVAHLLSLILFDVIFKLEIITNLNKFMNYIMHDKLFCNCRIMTFDVKLVSYMLNKFLHFCSCIIEFIKHNGEAHSMLCTPPPPHILSLSQT